MDVVVPTEYVYEHKSELKFLRDHGAGELDLDLMYELGENNASRSCSACGSEADYYLFKDRVVIEFRCSEHNQF